MPATDAAVLAHAEPVGEALLRRVLAFSRALRKEGLTADLAAVLDFNRALDLVDLGDRREVRAAGASLFVRRREEREVYEAVFERFWSSGTTHGPAHAMGAEATLDTAASGRQKAERTSPGELARRYERLLEATVSLPTERRVDPASPPTGRPAWSAGEALRHREFERMTPNELREAERLVDRLEPRLEQRRTRRWALHPHGSRVATRQMLRRNLASGGEPLVWLWRRPVRQPRSVVVICDISGSMERHSRLLLRFAAAMMRSRVRTEAFVFGTRLTRVTRHLSGRDPDAALDRVSAAVRDWAGGTRIGDSLRDFNQHWARRVLRTSGLVIVVSDGWDRGSAELVGTETERLARNCHRLIWLNPLAGDPGYRPLAAGMAAALPHVDVFLPAHDLASLEVLGNLLGRASARS